MSSRPRAFVPYLTAAMTAGLSDELIGTDEHTPPVRLDFPGDPPEVHFAAGQQRHICARAYETQSGRSPQTTAGSVTSATRPAKASTGIVCPRIMWTFRK